MEQLDWTATIEHAGTRWDQLVAVVASVSRAEAQRLLENGHAKVNGISAKVGTKCRTGDRLVVSIPTPKSTEISAEDIPLDVVFEDQHLMVINKPRGLVVHPAPGHETGTLVNAVLSHAEDLSGIGGELRPGIVHRLDKDTGGVMVVAKSDMAHQDLQRQIQAKTARRTYVALVWGRPKFKEARIDAPIGRHPVDRKRMAVITDPKHTSREAFTTLTVMELLGPLSLVRAQLETGRTHQIRVHCSWAGHPVVGDPLYGGIRALPKSVPAGVREQMEEAIGELNGQALHAVELTFNHPVSKELMTFSVELPRVMQNLLEIARTAERITP